MIEKILKLIFILSLYFLQATASNTSLATPASLRADLATSTVSSNPLQETPLIPIYGGIDMDNFFKVEIFLKKRISFFSFLKVAYWKGFGQGFVEIPGEIKEHPRTFCFHCLRCWLKWISIPFVFWDYYSHHTFHTNIFFPYQKLLF